MLCLTDSSVRKSDYLSCHFDGPGLGLGWSEESLPIASSNAPASWFHAPAPPKPHFHRKAKKMSKRLKANTPITACTWQVSLTDDSLMKSLSKKKQERASSRKSEYLYEHNSKECIFEIKNSSGRYYRHAIGLLSIFSFGLGFHVKIKTDLATAVPRHLGHWRPQAQQIHFFAGSLDSHKPDCHKHTNPDKAAFWGIRVQVRHKSAAKNETPQAGTHMK